jgi:hypothetical protein
MLAGSSCPAWSLRMRWLVGRQSSTRSRPAMGRVPPAGRLDVGLLGEAIRSGVRVVVVQRSGRPARRCARCSRFHRRSDGLRRTSGRTGGGAAFDAPA